MKYTKSFLPEKSNPLGLYVESGGKDLPWWGIKID
jgi:hypothetical protein